MTAPRARLAAVNVGRAQTHEVGGRKLRTAILKTSVAGRVAIGSEGIEGDQQADRRYHGGPDKAVYLYAAEHLAFWQQALRCAALPPGTFGENLTLEGWDDLEGTLHVGDVLQIGDGPDAAVIELTTPRQPCWKLEARMGIEGFAKAFLESGRMGSYARVTRPGTIAAGDAVTVIARREAAASLLDLQRAIYFGDRAAKARVLADTALDPALRRRVERGRRSEAAG